MAHATGTPVRIQRLTALVAILAVAVAVGLAFGRILQGHGATYRLVAVGLASGAIAWATERRGMLVATLLSAAGLALALTWLAAVDTAWYGLPSAETARTLGSLATQVGAQAREYVSPAPMTPALLLAGTIAVWAAVFSCYALAFRAQSPLLGLVPPLALVVFADSVLEEFVRPLYGIVFLLAALAVLFADSLRRVQGWGPVWSPTGNRDRLLPIAGRNARRVGLAALTVALLAPLFVPGFGTQAVVSLSSINSDGRVRLSPLVSMGAVLRGAEEDNPEILRVQTEDPSYWRMVTLDSFDGTTWQARPDEGTTIVSGSSIPGEGPAGQPFVQSITVLRDFGVSWLVAAANPIAITIEHDVSWHPASSSLQMDGWPDEGEAYTVISSRVDPTAKELRTAGAEAQFPTLVSLPATIPPVITETAQAWTAGLTTDFDRVMAIRHHLSTEFEYSLDVDYQDDPTALATMLTTTKKGFCQQFASLMAVMLRSIGIPARVALGFTTGTASTSGGTTSFVVRTRNYHAWVEVPFRGYGWLPFDGSPSFPGDPSATYLPRAQGEAPCPAPGRGCLGQNPGRGQGGGEHNVKGGGLNEEAGGVAGDLGLGAAPPGATDRPLGLLAAAALLAAAVLAIGVPLLHRLRRRRRLRAAREPRALILATYDVFGDRLAELGWPREPGETPQEDRRRLDGLGVLADGEDQRLAHLTTAVERAAYAAAEPDGETPAAARADADAVVRALRERAPWRQRVLGLYRRD